MEGGTVSTSQTQSMYPEMLIKINRSMSNTTKADKYIRLISNCFKFLRTLNNESKKKYALFYQHLLSLRQVLRWHGIYENIVEIHQKGSLNFNFENVNNFAFMVFESTGDLFDRFLFIFDTIGISNKSLYNKIDQAESDFYFVQCAIWLVFHLRTVKKTFKQGNSKEKKSKILKIIKYILDCLTSYCKFSKRLWELAPRNAAILGILSSIIGLWDMLA